MGKFWSFFAWFCPYDLGCRQNLIIWSSCVHMDGKCCNQGVSISLRTISKLGQCELQNIFCWAQKQTQVFTQLWKSESLLSLLFLLILTGLQFVFQSTCLIYLVGKSTIKLFAQLLFLVNCLWAFSLCENKWSSNIFTTKKYRVVAFSVLTWPRFYIKLEFSLSCTTDIDVLSLNFL